MAETHPHGEEQREREEKSAGELERGCAVHIPIDAALALAGDLTVPSGASGLVVFAHGSGSSRQSPRNRRVAEALQSAGIGTLLFDLLTPEEEYAERFTRHLRFDIPLLTKRLMCAAAWVRQRTALAPLPIGYFGASTGAAAALRAAALAPEGVAAVVSRGGRPDLAGELIREVRAPTLLIVGGADAPVIALNRTALVQLRSVKQLALVPDATHLFEEPGALDRVTELATRWFTRYLQKPSSPRAHAPRP